MKDTNSATVAPSRESVADCIARLGPPPDDIWQQWLGEARRSIGQTDSWSPNPNDPTWADWFVDDNGQLVPNPSLAKEHPEHLTAAAVSSDSTTSPTEPDAPADSDVPEEIDVPEESAPTTVEFDADRERTQRSQTEPNRSKKKNGKNKWIAAAGVAVAVSLVTWGFFPNGPEPQPEVRSASGSLAALGGIESNAPPPMSSPARTAETTRRPNSDPIDDNQSDESLETIMADVPDVADSIDNQLRSSGLSLDAFLPPEMLAASSPNQPAASAKSDPTDPDSPAPDGLPNLPISIDEISTTKTPGDDASSQADESLMADDLFADDSNAMAQGDGDPENEADEATQEQSTITRDPIAAKTFGIVLPSIPSSNETALPDPIELLRREEASGGSLPGELELSFPSTENGSAIIDSIRLVAVDASSRWSLIDAESSTTIAEIRRSEDEDSLQFGWSDAARDWSRSASLSQARITTDQGDTIFLRPSLDAEPIRLGLTKRDNKLKWNLQSPITPNLTQVALDVVVPKDVDLQWIEPIDSESPRNTRGVALLKLKKAEETAIVVRFDVKTTQSFSLRMRFGARLHPTMPWQWTDATSIRTSLAAVTNQLEAADRQLLDLDVAITRAERMRARRQEYLLEDQRDHIDEAVKGWTIVAKRLAELDQLVAFLEAGGEVRPKLSVTWPDQEQVLFGVND
ncbi:hypothetical protein [Neorhodopirellula pilleata]|nr:hypothetical protein [Neorhodopirellula pilleata]